MSDFNKSIGRFFQRVLTDILGVTFVILHFILTVLVIIVIPIISFGISLTLGYVSLGVTLSFLIFYLIAKDKEVSILEYVFAYEDNLRAKIIKRAIYFGFAIFTVFIFYIDRETEIQNNMLQEQKMSEIKSHTNEYSSSFSCVYNTNWIIEKGLIIIDMNDKEIDRLYYDIPESLKSYNHSDIQTVIQIWRTEKVVGTYTDGRNGIQKSCSFKIIDYQNSRCIYEDELIGTDPPSSKKHSGDAYGSNPVEELEQLIIRKTN